MVLDGTWSKAKTLWWRNPWLAKLNRLTLTPQQPSIYGSLRAEPRREFVSTLESVAAALTLCGEAPEIEKGLRASSGRWCSASATRRSSRRRRDGRRRRRRGGPRSRRRGMASKKLSSRWAAARRRGAPGGVAPTLFLRASKGHRALGLRDRAAAARRGDSREGAGNREALAYERRRGGLFRRAARGALHDRRHVLPDRRRRSHSAARMGRAREGAPGLGGRARRGGRAMARTSSQRAARRPRRRGSGRSSGGVVQRHGRCARPRARAVRRLDGGARHPRGSKRSSRARRGSSRSPASTAPRRSSSASSRRSRTTSAISRACVDTWAPAHAESDARSSLPAARARRRRAIRRRVRLRGPPQQRANGDREPPLPTAARTEGAPP